MNALAAALAISLLTTSDEDVVQRTHARILAEDVFVPTCRDVAAGDPERGLARVGFRYEISGRPRAGGTRYTGRVTFALGEVTIRLPRAIAWKGMTPADRWRAEALVRAVYHHEVGHVRVAEALRDALNAESTVSAPDYFSFGAAADARGREGFARFDREEIEYDRLTDHGRKQHLAPGDLAGPDTVLACR